MYAIPIKSSRGLFFSNGPSIVIKLFFTSDLIQKVEMTHNDHGLLILNHEIPSDVLLWIQKYLNKENPIPTFLDKTALRPFQKRVLEALEKIPLGTTLSYQDIAKSIDSHPRPVGGGCGSNPFPLFIPCHRVVAKNGFGGFSCGLEAKKELLAFEGLSYAKGVFQKAPFVPSH